ncbi:hypothetical protein FF125_10815 [Aureibaculum algae]|uniref:Uncharacterized protein n=1 Tax=Aureibaculum algae TaxID=2584122 RepID=A0A5B7TUA1_9FLAO|nr:hypothetical protein [Aureibaculum algae]QCX38901.1 hypothetical protein FF125_10815 [Aureibaculum algae]
MELTIASQTNISEIKESLSVQFPNYKVKYAFLNKKALNVINGSSMVIIFHKKNELKVMSNLNIMKSWMFVVFVLLLFLTFVGGFIFYGIIWHKKKKEFRALEQEVADFIRDTYGQSN